MSQMPELWEPVSATELPQELQQSWNSLIIEIQRFIAIHPDVETMQLEAPLLHQRVTRDVSEHPILAQTLRADLSLSLLDMFCTSMFQGTCHATIQFLIEANPHALLWTHRATGELHGTIQRLFWSNGHNWALLPWIAEHYPWVLDHEVCQYFPPHVTMMDYYNKGACDLEIVRAFYELYPKGLEERHSLLESLGWPPLGQSLEGPEEPDANLFIWMAELYPGAAENALDPETGLTILHVACYNLAEDYCSPNMERICRFLITKHSDLIYQTMDDGNLPIHMLAHRCNRPIVQEIAILLLKAHPDCIQGELSRFPFIQQVHPSIIEELEIESEIIMLAAMSQHMAQAVSLSTNGPALHNSLFGSVSDVFCSWANQQFSEALPERKQRILLCIADIRRHLEGTDG